MTVVDRAGGHHGVSGGLWACRRQLVWRTPPLQHSTAGSRECYQVGLSIFPGSERLWNWAVLKAEATQRWKEWQFHVTTLFGPNARRLPFAQNGPNIWATPLASRKSEWVTWRVEKFCKFWKWLSPSWWYSSSHFHPLIVGCCFDCSPFLCQKKHL